MVALIILGGAYSVVTLRVAGHGNDKPRANLEKIAEDSLTILNGIDDANGTLLDTAMLEQIHCARDPTPSASNCASGRGANLSFKLQSYLPPGVAYAVGLGNGVRAKDLYRSSQPSGESVSASFAYLPGWNLTFVVTELSCYDATQAVNATLIPLAHGRIANATRVNATLGAVNVTAVALGGRWNASFPAATRLSAGTIDANATAKTSGSMPGSTAFTSCAIGATGSALVTALRQDSLTIPSKAVIGANVTFQANLTQLAATSGATLLGSNLTIYDPIPARRGAPDTWVPAQVISWNGTLPNATWTPADESIFGTHPVVLRASVQVGATVVEARIVGSIDVALPSGVVPYDPPYRAVLQAWFPEWR